LFNKDLFEAVKDGNLDLIEELLERPDTDINMTNVRKNNELPYDY
jgi:hypothetical protein